MACTLLLEDGTDLLLEDGTSLLLEDCVEAQPGGLGRRGPYESLEVQRHKARLAREDEEILWLT